MVNNDILYLGHGKSLSVINLKHNQHIKSFEEFKYGYAKSICKVDDDRIFLGFALGRMRL